MIVLKYIYYRFYCFAKKFRSNNDFMARTVAMNLSNLPIAGILVSVGFLLFERDKGFLVAAILYVYIHMKLYNNVYPMDLGQEVVIFKKKFFYDSLIVVFYGLMICFFVFSLEYNRKQGPLTKLKRNVEVVDDADRNLYVPENTFDETDITELVEKIQQQNNTNLSQ